MNRKIYGPSLTSFALAALTACSGGEGDSSSVTVVDSAGVRIVTSTDDGSWGNDVPWSFEEIFRVGGIDGPEEERFGLVVSVDVDQDGRVYVADQQAKHVRVFEADGSYVGTLGSPGEGPGEIGAMFMGMFERSGEVWTVDPAGQGIQRFGLDEGYLGAIPFNIMGGMPIRLDEVDDGVIAQRRGIGLDGSIGESGDAVAMIGEEASDTLIVLPVGLTVTMDGGAPRVALFAPEPRWDIADNGAIAVAMDNRYRVEVRNADGGLDRIVQRDEEPVEVTESMESMLKQAMRDQMEAFGAPPAAIEPALSQMEFAETAPLLVQLVLESDGHLWVQRTTSIAEAAEQVDFDFQDLGSPRWDVFDPEGTYLGEIELPARFQPLRLIDGVFWGFALDEFDVQSIVGMRLVR